MTYFTVTCERCHCQFSWIGRPDPGEPIRCNTCENELSELNREVEATATSLATHWDEP